MSDKTINIYFILTPETLQDYQYKRLYDNVYALTQGQWQDIPNTILESINYFINPDSDHNISKLGKQQILDMQMTLKDIQFVDTISSNASFVGFTSPIERDLLPFLLSSHQIATKPIQLIESNQIFPSENMTNVSFEHWLNTLSCQCLVLTISPQLFNKHFKRNHANISIQHLDIWQLSGCYQSELNFWKWNEPFLFLRTPLSYELPCFEKISWMSIIYPQQQTHNNNNSQANNLSAENDDDNNNNEPICRICQSKQSETPQLTMIHPCKCSGTLTFVHNHCLNQWRKTSTEAYERCNVCNYQYQLKQSQLGKILLDSNVILTITIIFSLCFCYIFGWFLRILTGFVLNIPSIQTKVHLNSYSQIIQSMLNLDSLITNLICKIDYHPWTLKALKSVHSIEGFYYLIILKSIFCYESIHWHVDNLVGGFLVYGALFNIIRDVYSLLTGQTNIFIFVGYISLWSANHNANISLRIAALFGFLTSIRSCYNYLSSELREKCQDWLGDEVLEYLPSE